MRSITSPVTYSSSVAAIMPKSQTSRRSLATGMVARRMMMAPEP